jgi:replicative DNA helicase
MKNQNRQHWSDEAEQSVLGGLMLDPRAYMQVEAILTPASFFDSRHGQVFAAATWLAMVNRPIDPITLFEVLRERGQIGDGLDLGYLNAMSQSVPSASNIVRYAEIVAIHAAQRELIATADAALNIAMADGSVADKLDNIAASFLTLESRAQRTVPRPVAEVLGQAIDRYTALAEGTAPAGLKTGIAPLDRLLGGGGLLPGRVYGIAARPSVGKSSAARAILLHVARAGQPALLLSQEMPADELADALVAESGRIDSRSLQSGDIQSDDWERIVEAVETLRPAPLYLDDQGGLTLAQVRAKARAVRGLQVLAIDYLQLMTTTAPGKSTNDGIAEITKGLKQLALEMRVPILLLSQLNREVEKRADKEPMLSDLRDSGAIEQDLDTAIMLWTAKESAEGDTSRLVGWKVAKQRNGPKGVFAMRWSPAINAWAESYEPLRNDPAPTKRTRGYE